MLKLNENCICCSKNPSYVTILLANWSKSYFFDKVNYTTTFFKQSFQATLSLANDIGDYDFQKTLMSEWDEEEESPPTSESLESYWFNDLGNDDYLVIIWQWQSVCRNHILE